MKSHRTGDQEHLSICKAAFWRDLVVWHLGYRMFEFARRMATGIKARMSSVLSFHTWQAPHRVLEVHGATASASTHS